MKTYKCDYCPLATNTYGIEPHHQVRHIPCIRRSNSQISLFEHLKQYHYLNYAASMQIVRLVASGDLDDHPALFSSATESSIVSILPSFFRAPCPLTQHHVFGLGPIHGIRLCSPSAEQQDFALYDHFLAFHQLNRASAMKLVKAMMKNENSSQRVLFRPDEQVLNETAYVSCPLSNYNAVLPHQERIPHTPCQSTVKLRYLTGHLRDVHHLNKTAAKRIASALRNEQGTIDGRSIGLFERDENTLKSKKKKVNPSIIRCFFFLISVYFRLIPIVFDHQLNSLNLFNRPPLINTFNHRSGDRLTLPFFLSLSKVFDVQLIVGFDH